MNGNSDKKQSMQEIIDSYKDQLKQYYSQTHTSDVVDNDLIASEKTEYDDGLLPVLVNPKYNDFMVYDGENVYDNSKLENLDNIDGLEEAKSLCDEMYYDMEKFYSPESVELMELAKLAHHVEHIGQIDNQEGKTDIVMQDNTQAKPKQEGDKTSTGKLKVMVFTARQALPVENAEVSVFKLSQGEEQPIASLKTNVLGSTAKFELETNDHANTGYIMKITCEGFVPTTYFNLRVSPFSAVIYSVDMVPLVASPNAKKEMQYFLD